jgi:chemotaxis protein MotA
LIGGAAVGTLLAANPLPLVVRIFKSVLSILAGSKYTKEFYLESLKMLSAIFVFARTSGMAKLEEDVENPGKARYSPSIPS